MKTAPDPLYVQAFLFKEADTCQVFDFKTSTCIPPACNLLVADKKRGLLYIGHDDMLSVYKPAEENNAEWKLDLQLPGIISKTAINCDCSYVAVALAMKPTILVYDAQSLIKNNLLLLLEIVSSNKPDSYVTDIRWNPTVATMFCTVTSDYTIGTFNLKAEEGNSMFPKLSVIAKVSNEPQALCATWSPKGKQMVVGCKNGDIVQLKPDTLKVARTITGPSPFIGEVISILWISNYQFCAAYVNSERHINVLIIDAVKGESNATFTCYEDITYGFPDADGEGSVPRYYFEHVPEWGLIVAGSSISSEIALLGTTDGGTNWNQWQLVDSGRAQLPLMRTTEIYPIGLVVDRSSTKVLPWGADSTLPHPVPILRILTTSGRLCSFHMVNLASDCPAINSPPTEVVTVPALVTSLNPSHSAVPSTEMSFNINAAATSTPSRPKQADVVPDRTPAPVANIFGNSLKVAGFFQQSVEQPKLQEEKPMSLVVTKSPAVLKETPILEPPKTEIKLAADKEVSSPQAAEQKASIDDSIRMRAYLQEQELFEKELRNRLESHVCEINIWESDEEKKRLRETSFVIEQFLRDLKDTTNSLSSDIAYLKALLLQSFAWVEETKSKNAASIDIGRNCSENSKIADLRRWYYYTQTQLNQISKVLDLEWLEHKDLSKKLKMKIPSLEYVYQNLLLHHKILTKEKEKIEQISRQWKSRNRLGYRPNDVSSLNCSMASLHVSSPKSPVSAIREKTDIIDARCKAIATKTLSFTHEKQIKLKALLTESPPKTIKLVNQSTIQDRLEATLFSLASVNPALTEAKTKPEPPIVSKQTTVKQTLEKSAKSLSPLASLNSIVARIGSSDTSSTIVQNKPQQKAISTTVSFPVTISTKQTEKKSVVPATTKASQPKLKQDFNAFPSSITFGMSAPKSQEMLFPKSPLIDASARNKESTISDSIPKAPESALFSTGLLKEALSTKYPLSADTARVEVAHNLPLLSAASIAKPDPAATFSFAVPTIPPTVTKSSPGAALDSMSFAYSKSQQSPIIETPAMTAPTLTQAPIELSALSLGSPVSLTLQSANHSGNDGKVNPMTGMNFAISTPASVTTQSFSMTPVATTIATISGVTISLVDANAARKSTDPVPSINSISIEKLPAPEMKAPSFEVTSSANAASTSLPATQIFGQPILKNTSTVSEVTTTPSTAINFGAAVFPSITPTFSTSGTSASTTSVFSGFANASIGASSLAAPVSSTVSPFQNSLSKPFGQLATTSSMPATSFSISPSNTSASTISFGLTAMTTMTTTTATTTTTAASSTTASIAPAFGKSPVASPTSNAQFPGVQTISSTANVFEKPIISPASTPFGSSSSVFSNVPAASSSASSIFGGTGSSNTNSIFGSTPLSSASGSIFGGNATVGGVTGFGMASSRSLFGDTSAQKSGIMFGETTNTASTSPFGSTSNNTTAGSSAGGASVFGSPATNTSPIQQPILGNQPAFGQAPAFGSSPVFGSAPIFGGTKSFGGGFGSPPTFESPGIGFGSQPVMQGSMMENMPKVFGEVAGSSTFESLANQSGGLSFGSLAQKSPEPEKPTFTTGSSFSSWR